MLQLIYALTGDDAYPPILDGQLPHFLRKLTLLLEDAIWLGQIRGRDEATRLFEAYNIVPPEIQASIFLSPEGYQALHALFHSVSDDNFKSLRRMCEEVSNGSKPSSGFTGSDDNTVFIVDGKLKIDIGSEFCKRTDPTSPVFFEEFQPFLDNEVSVIKTKVSDAFAEITSVTPTLARLIQNYGRTIFIRKNSALNLASEQVDTELGGIRLLNVHLNVYTHAQLMDDMIHESVHNFLATFELLNYPFVVYGSDNDPNARPVSPWSMRPIRVLPFLHAAFVYFAILHFSQKRLKKSSLTAEQRPEALARRDHYASGFLIPGTLSSKIPETADADVRVLKMLDWMQAVVVDQFKAVDPDGVTSRQYEAEASSKYVSV